MSWDIPHSLECYFSNQRYNACSAAMFNSAKMPDPTTMSEPTTMSDYHCNVQSIPHVTLTDSYCTIHVKIPPPCHSERSGTDIGIQAIKSKMPRSRTPKGRQQAESRHSCKVYHIAVSKYHYRKLTPPAGAQSEGSAPQISPLAAP